jgi:hypothetical protein
MVTKPIALAITALAAVASFVFARGPEEPAPRRSFHELHLGGEPNGAGFALLGVRKDGRAYRLQVSGASVTARPEAEAGSPLGGSGLVGLVMDLRDERDRRYELRVDAVRETRYWADPKDPVPTYTLTYTSAGETRSRPLCTTTVNEALLFSGDRYDAGRKRVTATGPATDGWFNIACAATALAKLHLTRHTEASQTTPTTAAERQAMLKMFAADVCGDGTAFTVQGQPLLWADRKGVTAFASEPASREAVWSDRGALCLDVPRRPEMEAEIPTRCRRPPRCSELPPSALAAGHVTSANPR